MTKFDLSIQKCPFCLLPLEITSVLGVIVNKYCNANKKHSSFLGERRLELISKNKYILFTNSNNNPFEAHFFIVDSKKPVSSPGMIPSIICEIGSIQVEPFSIDELTLKTKFESLSKIFDKMKALI